MIFILSENSYNQVQIIEYSTNHYIIDTIEDGYESIRVNMLVELARKYQLLILMI
jgi:hypothetical protein